MTRDDLLSDLRTLGPRPGTALLVHTSMRRIGRLIGGATALAEAIFAALGPDGTIVVPTPTPENSDSSRAHLARVEGMTAAERRRHRAAMPAFDPARTPSTAAGVFPESVRLTPGALRSEHPQTSFAAVGAQAKLIIDGHAPDCHLGEESPLARLYDLDAEVLMLGTGYDTCTALHLAEYRYTGNPPTRGYSCVIERDGEARWWTYEDVVLDDRDFLAVGAAFDDTAYVRRGRVGFADSRLVSLRRLVDFAAGWFAATRDH
ncbi:aminoglycoside N(3)-acetyltransferase [Actinoallomurus iriomotensis]|uniref:Aminoglycoside N(3)-acetyltransferase n=1 Tax=Actinoallomurus iriomotensis TaxID=478107 RepID=A0A9W6S1G1_9ACTN|nr:AAC(3) family N-acetyltransferase [Actinoallomurus iriomotensis]GLY86756.1 AAC(3) family N-acetyltransferase [Actinoallomurus iriomotensis]